MKWSTFEDSEKLSVLFYDKTGEYLSGPWELFQRGKFLVDGNLFKHLKII